MLWLLHTAQLMPLPLNISCFSKIQIGFTFLVPAHLGSPGQRAVKRVCVCYLHCLQCFDTVGWASGRHRHNRRVGPGPWDASRPTLEIIGTNCIWSPPTFAIGCRFSLGNVGSSSTDLHAKFKGRSKKGKGMGETWVDQ